MAGVNLQSKWTIELNIKELRLVIHALSGTLVEREFEDAYDLSVKISEQRAHATKLAMKQADQLLGNIESNER